MIDEKQINNIKNERRDKYCIRIQKALQYKGNCDHEDLPSILVAFEKELTNELLPENAVVLTKEDMTKYAKDCIVGQATGLDIINALIARAEKYKEQAKQARKQTARAIFYKIKETLIINNEENTEFFDYNYTLETIDELAKQYGVEVEE